MVKFTLDGIELEVEPGTTILKAAQSISIDIPTFCFHDRLSLSASCRMCLVEVEGRGKLEPACATAVAQDMVINSHSEKVVETRGDMLEMLLANHPLDCPVCDKGGECELQDTVFEYGRGDSRLRDPKRVFRTRDIELNNVIVFNANRCIQCQRCVRMCEEVVGEVALGTSERGLDSEITGVGNSLKDCSHCGNCIEVCPVGALMSTPYRYKARPWDLVKTETICGMCGTGCSMTVEMRDGTFKRVKSDPKTGLNGELLCAKGRFGFDAIDGGERVHTPLIRKNDVLTPVSWEEAINFVARKALEIRTNNGQTQGQISPRQTNETALQFQKLMRHAFKTSDINSSSRFNSLRDIKTVNTLTHVIKNVVDRRPSKEILEVDCILVLGANVTEENPVTGYLIRAAMRKADKHLLVASSRPCGLDDIATSSIRLIPGNETHLLSVLAQKTEAIESGNVAKFASVAAPALAGAESITLLVGSEFLRSASANQCLQWIAHTTENLKKAGKSVFVQFLFDRPNQLGLWDMGCLPGIDQPSSPDAVPDLVYVVGADPLTTCAGDDPCRVAAQKSNCLVVQTSHMNQTAEQAHVVLPVPSYGEENGTYTGNSGLPQTISAVRKAPVPDASETLRMIAEATVRILPPEDSELLSSALITDDLNPMGMVNNRSANTIVSEDLQVPAEIETSPDRPRRSYNLITGDGQFHSGTISNRSKILQSLEEGPYVEMNPGGGSAMGSDGTRITLKCGSSHFSGRLKINEDFSESTVFVPECYLQGYAKNFLDVENYPTKISIMIEN